MRKVLSNQFSTTFTKPKSSTFMQKRFATYYHYTDAESMKSIKQSGKLRASTSGNMGPGVYATKIAPYFSDPEIGLALRNPNLPRQHYQHYVKFDSDNLKKIHQPFKEFKSGAMVVDGDVDLAKVDATFGERD